MNQWIAVSGWVLAGGGALTAVRLRRLLARRMEDVARACHEARGPLTAARLGLSLGQRTGRLSSDRLRALDQELERAARAIADLDYARGASAAAVIASEIVDLEILVADSVRPGKRALRPVAPSSTARGRERRRGCTGIG